jgi:CBS domain-containing protein
MRVKEIMIKEFKTILPGATIREAVAMFRTEKGQGEGGMPSLLVTEGERLVGIVTLSDIVKAVLPPYMAQDPHLAHLAWDGLLERQCGRIKDKAVDKIMTRKVVTVNEEAVLTEAAELFFEHSIHSLPVVRKGKVVGILYLSDLAKLILNQLEESS